MKPGYLSVLAHNLRIRRQALRETQLDFAKACHVSYRLYQRLESATGNPTLSSLASIAKRLNVEIVELLTLRMIRSKESSQDYYDLLCEKFKNSPYAVGIRDGEGMILWANKSSIQLHHLEGKDFPIDVRTFVSAETAETYKRQMLSEKLGISHPYTNQLLGMNGEPVYIRYHPILVYLGQAKYPNFTIAYSSEVHSYSEADYYRFSSEMIACFNALEVGPVSKQ